MKSSIHDFDQQIEADAGKDPAFEISIKENVGLSDASRTAQKPCLDAIGGYASPIADAQVEPWAKVGYASPIVDDL